MINDTYHIDSLLSIENMQLIDVLPIYYMCLGRGIYGQMVKDFIGI